MIFNKKISNKKDDQDDTNSQSISVGGVEGAPVNIEQTPTQVEQGSEKALEQTKEQQEQVPQSETPKKVKSPKPTKKVLKQEKKTKIEPIFGYNTPTNIIKQATKKKGKGDPKKGVTWLWVFWDKILRKGETQL